MKNLNTYLEQFLKASLLLIITVLLACGTGPENENVKSEMQGMDSLNSEKSIAAYMEGKSLVYTKYKLPLSVSLFELIRDSKPEFEPEILNSRDNLDRFTRDVDKAINLGFYSADLAYCSILENNEAAVDYFRTTKKLAEELNIAIGYSEAMVDRFQMNMDNHDSLYHLSNTIYWRTCNYLEENEDVNILPFIIVGSWLESVYLTIYSFENAAENNKVIEQVAAQKQAVDNLIEYLYQTMLDMKVFNVNADIQRMSNHLKDLKVSYDKLEDEGMTSLLFDEIKHKYRAIREKYLFEEY